MLAEKTVMLYSHISDNSENKKFSEWLASILSKYITCQVTAHPRGFTIYTNFKSRRQDTLLMFKRVGPSFMLAKDSAAITFWDKPMSVVPGPTFQINLTRIIKRAKRMYELEREESAKKAVTEFEFGTIVTELFREKFAEIGLPSEKFLMDNHALGTTRVKDSILKKHLYHTIGHDIIISNHDTQIIIPRCDKNTAKNIWADKIYCQFRFLPKSNGRAKVRTWNEIATAIKFFMDCERKPIFERDNTI